MPASKIVHTNGGEVLSAADYLIFTILASYKKDVEFLDCFCCEMAPVIVYMACGKLDRILYIVFRPFKYDGWGEDLLKQPEKKLLSYAVAFRYFLLLLYPVGIFDLAFFLYVKSLFL